jgi:hypothetical protein
MAFGAMRCFVGLMPVLVVQFNHRKRQKISTFFPATNRRTLIPSSPTREISYELNRAHTPLATAH